MTRTRTSGAARPFTLQVLAGLALAAAAAAQPRQVDLRLDDPVEVTWDGGTTLALVWQAVEDSRCPLDVVCVWEGEVAARLEARAGDGEPQALTLTFRHEGDERATASVAGFQIRLLGVDPYPVAAKPPAWEDYLARLVVAPPGDRLPVDTAVAARSWGEVKRAREANAGR